MDRNRFEGTGVTWLRRGVLAMAAVLTLPLGQPAAYGAAGDIVTVAGTGVAGYAGDGGSPLQAAVNYPTDAVSAFEKLWIVDQINHRVRVVDERTNYSVTPSDPNPVKNEKVSVMQTLSGNGVAGFAGDGGDALHASFLSPQGIAVCSSNGVTATDVYVADTGNNRVRRIQLSDQWSVSTSGNISKSAIATINTVAGTGAGGYSGDGGSALAARLNTPLGVACTKDKLFIADTLNHRVRVVDLASGVIQTYAGNGTAGYSGDGGPATQASLRGPRSVFVDTKNNLWIADSSNHVVRVVEASTTVNIAPGSGNPISQTSGPISTVAGTGVSNFSGDGGSAKNATLSMPSDIAATYNPQGDLTLLIVDTWNHRVRKVSAPVSLQFSTSGNIGLVSNGTITTAAGNGAGTYAGDGGPATQAALNSPRAITADFVIVDRSNHRLRRVQLS